MFNNLSTLDFLNQIFHYRKYFDDRIFTETQLHDDILWNTYRFEIVGVFM